MPEMHLKQPEFTYSAWPQLAKNKERIQKFKETWDTKYIYRNELDKTCFQHDMDYGDFKDLARRTVSDTFLRDKTFSIAKNPKYDGYERGIASIVYKFFDKKTTVSDINNEIKQNKQLAEKLNKFKKMKNLFFI